MVKAWAMAWATESIWVMDQAWATGATWANGIQWGNRETDIRWVSRARWNSQDQVASANTSTGTATVGAVALGTTVKTGTMEVAGHSNSLGRTRIGDESLIG